jgi:hypothetical protein
MSCLPNLPKAWVSALDLRPTSGTTSNHCEKPEAGAQILPISAALGREISAHAARARAKQNCSGEETWNPDER